MERVGRYWKVKIYVLVFIYVYLHNIKLFGLEDMYDRNTNLSWFNKGNPIVAAKFLKIYPCDSK